MTTVQCVICAIVPRAGVPHRLFFLSSDATVRERLASGPITKNQWAKNFLSSAFVSAGRCSIGASSKASFSTSLGYCAA